MAGERGRLYLGTSGFAYGGWRGRFYPQDLPHGERLAFYARHFNAVEINASFYRIPQPAAVRRWVQQVPEGFAFAFKAPRVLTHELRLVGGADALARFLAALAPAREAGRLAGVLWQLPPSFGRDLERLAAFTALLPADMRHAFEFRHPTWRSPDVLEFFRQAGPPLAFVDADGPSVAPPDLPAGRFVYVRRHGTEGLGRGAYGRERLEPLAARLRALLDAGYDALVFFNNDAGAAAVDDARTLADLLAPYLAGDGR